MKKILIISSLILLFPITTYAAIATGWNTPSLISGYIQPTTINGIQQSVQASFFTATSTTATSTFANGLNLTGGCFEINGACFTGAGTNYWTLSGSNLYNNSGTNVGIGTMSPNTGLELDGSKSFSIGPDGGSVMPALHREGAYGGLAIDLDTSAGAFSSNLMTLLGNGNVGIGTTVPANKLDIAGGVAVGTFAGTVGISNGLVSSGNISVGTTSNMSAGLGVDANVTGTGVKVDAHSASNNYEEFDVQKAAKWYVIPGGNSPNDLGFVNSSFAQTLTLQQGGNVGIGTMSPAYKLDVSGGNIRVNQDGDVNDSVLIGDIGSTYPGVWFGSNAISPSYINYSFLWDKTLGTLLNAPSGVNGTTFRIANNPVAAINANGMAIGYGNASATTPSSGNGLIVAGNVGIGTTTPSQALDVNGNVNIESGNGFLMRDTVLGTCKLITLTSGVLVGTTHACQ